MRIPGLVVAGGAASRLGGSKPLLPFHGGTLLDAVIARAAPQVSQLALNVPRTGADEYRTRFPNSSLLFDSFPEHVGPLAGVIAGLEWARALGDTEWLAMFPCDTPFLPLDIVAQLMRDAHAAPVFAHDGKRLQGLSAVWPLRCLHRLREGVEDGALRSLHSAMEALGGETRMIQGDAHAFFNVNTREDLARAEEIAQGM